jgi:hypothetical protein
VCAGLLVEAGEEDVFRKVAGDLKAKNVAVADDVIRRKMAELAATARQQVLTEG